MRKLKFWLAPVGGLLLCASSLLSQVPSETFDWLRNNLGGAACVVFQMGPSKASLQPVTENTEVQFIGCDMTLATATTTGPKSEIRTFHVPLGKLSPKGLSLSEGFRIPVGWVTAGEVPAMTLRLASPGGDGFEAKLEQFGMDAPPSAYRASEINILLLHKDTADRLVTELSRAITFCSGK